MRPRPPKPEDEMRKLRTLEAKIEQMLAHQSEIEKTTQRAAWEVTTTETIARRGAARRIGEMKQKHALDLTQRKMRLAHLLSSDLAQWRGEIANFGETAEMRKERLSSRARALGERRERERRAFVEEAYARQNRLACDEVRSRDSEAVMKVVAVSRLEQVKDKAERVKADKAKEAIEAEELLHRLAEADAIEEAKLRDIKSHEHDVKFVLDEQVALLKKRKAAAKARAKEEAEAELVEWRAAIEAEEAEQARLKEDARRRGLEVLEKNKLMLGKNGLIAQAERAEDLTLLKYQLELERAADGADADKAAHEKEMAARYKADLDGFEKRVQQESADVDAERLKLENRIWDKKNAEQQANDDARAFLMAQVDAGRQQQIADARALAVLDKSTWADEIQAIKDQQDEVNAEEDRKAEMHRQAALANQAGILAQIELNKQKRQAEDQAAFLEAKLQEKVSTDYSTMVAGQGGRVNFHHPLQSTNWYS